MDEITLTEQQAVIVAGIADGLTMSAVAENIGRPYETIKDDYKRIQNILGVRTQAAVVAKAIRDGLIS